MGASGYRPYPVMASGFHGRISWVRDLRPVYFSAGESDGGSSRLLTPCQPTPVGVDFPVIAVELDSKIEERLELLARKTGRSKTFFAREAIEQHLEDLEDYYLGLEAMKNPGRLYTPDEAKRELGL